MPNYSATRATIVTGTSEKTMIEIATPSTNAALVYHFGISFDGVSASATPVLVELKRATASITGSSLTPAQLSTDGPSTANVTAKHTGTAGSATNLGNTLYQWAIPPTTGYEEFFPDNRLITVAASSFLRVNVTAGATVNATVFLAWQE